MSSRSSRTIAGGVATAFVAVAMLAVGCNQTKNDAKSTARGENARTPTESPSKEPKTPTAKPSPEPHSDTPAHPAVSDRVGPEAESPPGDVPPSDSSKPAETPGNPANAAVAKPAPLGPPPGALPSIALTAAHRATCKVFAGDVLPPMSLVDLDGAPAPLDKLFGERLTVVLFWQHTDPDAVEAVDDMASLVLKPYGNRGVRAVAIHVGPATDEIKAIVQRDHVTYPVLVDADGAALGQVAADVQGLMPRIFLVDAAGRILWFDIEYSRTTRRDLDLALRFLTRQ